MCYHVRCDLLMRGNNSEIAVQNVVQIFELKWPPEQNTSDQAFDRFIEVATPCRHLWLADDHLLSIIHSQMILQLCIRNLFRAGPVSRSSLGRLRKSSTSLPNQFSGFPPAVESRCTKFFVSCLDSKVGSSWSFRVHGGSLPCYSFNPHA